MEVERKKPIFYRIRVSDDQVIKVHEKIFAYLRTLQDMINFDASVSDEIIPLPTYITPVVMQWIIDALTIYIAEGETHIQTFDDLYVRIDLYNTLRSLQEIEVTPLLSSLRLDNIESFFPLLEALNWLDVRELLLLVLDQLYQLLSEMTTTEIEQLLLTKKRKFARIENGDTATTDNLLPYTPYYIREKLIYDYLSQSLVEDLIRVVVPRIQKYINPIACGKNHQLFLKAGGRLFGTGSVSTGPLGIKRNELLQSELTPLHLPNDAKALLISCGEAFSLCWTDKGLFGAGSNAYGQLSLPYTSGVEKWTKIEVAGEVLILETGIHHTMILTTSGLYSCGTNSSGQLGLGDFGNRRRLTRIEGLSGVVLQIICGDRSTIVVTTKGLYGAGSTLSLPYALDLYQNMSTFQLLADQSLAARISSIDSGSLHTMFISNKTLYARGKAARGQTGHGWLRYEEYEKIEGEEDTEIQLVDEIPVSVYCGSSSSFVLTQKGLLYATGINTRGELGVGDREDRETFDRTTDLDNKGKILSLTSKEHRTFVITTEGLFMAGEKLDIFNLDEKVALFSTSFRELPIDLGYRANEITLVLEEEEPQRKKQRTLQCHLCTGKARFISSQRDNTPFCSRYCLYKSSS